MFIEDGRGRGNLVGIDSENRIAATATMASLQHYESHTHGQTYQALGSMTVASGTNNILYLENENADLEFAISYMRIQAVDLTGGTTLPSANTYFQIGFDNTYTSGGDGVTPINMNRGSANVADISAYTNNPTLGGDFIEVDRWYVKAEGDMMTFNKEASLILPKNKSLTIRLITDHSGTAYARATFFYLSG